MVVQNGERKTAVSVQHFKVALMIHLPEVIRVGMLESFVRCCSLAGFRVNAIVSAENVVHRALAGDILYTLILQNAAELSGAPCRMLVS